MRASPYGVHRAVDPPGVLPYQAFRLDNSPSIAANECRVTVERLNLDSASFAQLLHQAGGRPEGVPPRVLEIVRERGKMHNPVTGSGGVLIGRVAEVGDRFPGELQPGDRLVTLVSLTTTPLFLQDVGRVHGHQIEVNGHAILFAKSLWAKLPQDLPEALVLSVLDVCGAPAQTERLVGPHDRVVILGAGGKSGLLCAQVALDRVLDPAQILAIEPGDGGIHRLKALFGRLNVAKVDATDALAVMQAVETWSKGEMADLVINCVNVPHTEMAAALSVRTRGRVYFFSMATSFQAAALGAESVGQDIEMLIGNGYAEHHADFALDLVRRHPILQDLLL